MIRLSCSLPVSLSLRLFLGVTTAVSALLASVFTLALDGVLRASQVAGALLSRLNLKGGWVKVIGKGVRERRIPIGNFVKMTLWRYVEEVRHKPRNNDSDRFFLSREGEPVSVNTIK